MPRPFPFPFNIGTDICSIDRIYQILKGVNGRRFVRRVLIERERHEGVERLDGPLERWKLAGRTSSVLEWKMKELGLTTKELSRRRNKLKGKLKKELLAGKEGKEGAEGDAELGKKEGKKIRSQIRAELKRELEREIRAEEEAERLAKEEGGKRKVGGRGVAVVKERGGMEVEKELEKEGEKEEVIQSDALNTMRDEIVQTVMGKKEGPETGKEGEEIEKDEKTLQQMHRERLEITDVMLRLLEENDREMGAAAKGLLRAAEFLAGRFAAKEAAIKAHLNRKLTYHSIAIHRPPDTDPSKGSEAPVAIILPESGKWEEGQEAKISISHDGDYATAVCLAVDPRPKRKDKMDKPGSLQPTGAVIESTRDIFTQLDIEDMDPEEEDDHKWRKKEDAFRAKEEEFTAINDPQILVRVEKISPDVTAEDLLELFKGKSETLRAVIPLAADGKKLPFGYVSFAKRMDAVRARGQMDRTVLKGQKITTRWMGGKKAKTRGLGSGGKKIFKADRLEGWVEYVEPGTKTSAAVVGETKEKKRLAIGVQISEPGKR